MKVWDGNVDVKSFVSSVNVDMGKEVCDIAFVGFIVVRCFHILEGNGGDIVETASSDINSVVVDVELDKVVSSEGGSVDFGEEGAEVVISDVDIGAIVGGIVSFVGKTIDVDVDAGVVCGFTV